MWYQSCQPCATKKRNHNGKKKEFQNKVVLEPLVEAPDLAIYIFKQVKVKMTLDLVHITLIVWLKHEASHSVPMIQVYL